MQFTGTVKSFDEDEGKGVIVRDRDKHEIVVTPRGFALGLTTLFEDDRVEFDVDLSVVPQARNVIRI
jgi:cold shock CspA family protein